LKSGGQWSHYNLTTGPDSTVIASNATAAKASQGPSGASFTLFTPGEQMPEVSLDACPNGPLE
jgi:hypothetical protein